MVMRTDDTVGMTCEYVTITGHNGDQINAYVARPAGPGPYPGMVLIHHMPGWDEWYFEATRRFAQHGYATVTPNLYARSGHGTPEDVAAVVRSQGGVPDAQVVGDLQSSIRWLREQPYANGKVGLFGTCSGGRHGFLAACRLGDEVDALIECWGGRVVMGEGDLTPNQPVSPNTLTADLRAPILGLFGNEDKSPPPEQVDQHESELRAAGKDVEFHRYDGAGHGFFYYDRAAYRQEQAVDGWNKIWEWLPKHLA